MKLFPRLFLPLIAGMLIGGSLVLQIMDRPAPAADQMTPAQPAPVGYDMPHMKRPNLVVADLARSLVIYRDILGFTAGDIATSGPNSFSYPVFNIPAGTPMRSVALHEPGEQRVIALTELASLDLPRPHDAPYMSTVVIGITDLEGKFARLADMGLSVTETRIAEGAEFTFIEQAFTDPDGHLIVCYEVMTP